MCNSMDKLTQPKTFQLIAFGFVATPVLFYLVYMVSFSWMFYMESLTVFVFAPVTLFFLLSVWLDKRLGTKIKRYSILTVFLLLLTLLVFNPIKKWIISDTEKRGEILAKSVDDYRIKYGHYPKNLNDPFFDNAPKTALIRRPFWYEIYKNDKNVEEYEISCSSFNGQFATKYSGNQKWIYHDWSTAGNCSNKQIAIFCNLALS